MSVLHLAAHKTLVLEQCVLPLLILDFLILFLLGCLFEDLAHVCLILLYLKLIQPLLLSHLLVQPLLHLVQPLLQPSLALLLIFLILLFLIFEMLSKFLCIDTLLLLYLLPHSVGHELHALSNLGSPSIPLSLPPRILSLLLSLPLLCPSHILLMLLLQLYLT